MIGKKVRVRGLNQVFEVYDQDELGYYLKGDGVECFRPLEELMPVGENLVARGLIGYLNDGGVYSERLVKFYGLMFEPEMISSMFEGVEYLNNCSGLHNDLPRGDIYFAADKYLLFVGIDKYRIVGDEFDEVKKWPNTIDQFLTDMLRAGVFLRWKEEVYYRYHEVLWKQDKLQK